MTQIRIARGSHAVRFFESEEQTCRAVADYFLEDARLDDHYIMIARAGTYAGVRRMLESEQVGGPGTISIADRIRFADSDSLFGEFVCGEELDLELAEKFFTQLLLKVPAGGENSRIRVYGDFVDVLCERGHYAIAFRMEDMTGLLFAYEPRLSILCGYQVRHFGTEVGLALVRAVCSKHTDIGPNDPIECIRAQMDTAVPPRSTAAAEVDHPIVCVVDDDPSMRRSLARFLSLSEFRVCTFESAEAFLKEAEMLSADCLVVDIQLSGMTGLDLIAALAARGSQLPVIAMSGFHDERFESEALRLGARSFLHKPFEPQLLLDAVASAIG